MSRRAYIGLDLIRFGAACAVLAFHLGYLSWADNTSTPGGIVNGISFEEIAPITWFGWVGVHIFFVLSGFVISYAGESVSPGEFVRNRFLRLYPASLICSGLTAITVWLLPDTPGDLLLRAARSASLYPFGPWIDGVYWTLGIEMSFYALVFALLVLKKFDRLGLAMTILSAMSAAYFAVELVSGHAQGDARWWQLSLLPDGCFFAIGTFLWLRSRRKLTWLERIAWAIAGVTGAAQLYAMALGKVGLPGAGAPFIPPLVWLAACGLIAASVRWNDAIWTPRRALIARTIGIATYPLYLLHDVVGAALLQTLPLPSYLALATAIAAVGLASFAISAWAEPLVRTRLRRLLDSGGSVLLSTQAVRSSPPRSGPHQ